MDYGIDTKELKNIYQTPYSFSFDHIKISTDRINRTIDVSRVTSELVIYEHLDKPFLTAKLLFIDADPSINIVDDIHFLGTEKVEIKLRNNMTEEFAITKKFVVSEVSRAIKSGDGNEGLALELVEDCAYVSALMKVSKSYTDKKENIIKSLVKMVDRELMIPKDVDISGDKLTKLIVPNMTPLAAANWIKDRTYTHDGFPYFLYSTIGDDRLRLLDLKSMLSLPPMNHFELPYTYSMAYAQDMQREPTTNPDAGANIHKEAYTIGKFTAAENEKHLQLARAGHTSGTYNFVDTTTGNNIKVNHKMGTTLAKMNKDDKIGDEVYNKYPVYDVLAGFGTENKLVEDFDTREITHFATSRQFNDFADTESYHEGKTSADHKQKVVARSLRHWVLKSSYDIQVPGKNFLYKDANMTIGNIIRCRFLANRNYHPDMTIEDLEDQQKTGDYLIYAAKHTFSNQVYGIDMTIGRLGTKKYGTLTS